MADDDLKADILECLTTLEVAVSWAICDQTTNPPNPGLWLKNGGGIGLPLSDRDAEALVAASRQAPFGKGEDTIVDTAVRKTWELSPADFQITNPAFGLFVRDVVKKVSAGLGVDAAGKGVRAELYKMLLYDEGGHFKPQQDSEKTPGTFATLVISLPTKHEGGEVRVTHAGATKIFDTSRASSFDSSYLAWFSDVTYEVRPVVSGHRLVLTYNLVHETLTTNELAAGSNKSLAKLRKLFARWKSGVDADECEFSHFHHLLSAYTPNSLGFGTLKGEDHESVSLLRQICDETGFSLYLANMETCLKGTGDGCDEDPYQDPWDQEMVDIEETTTTLEKVIDIEGRVVAENLSVEEPEFLEEDPFEDKKPDDRGDDGEQLKHIYLRTVVLIIPKSFRIHFFLGSSSPKPKFIEWIDTCMSEVHQKPEDERPRIDAQDICESVFSQTKAWSEAQALLPLNARKPNPAIPQETIERIFIATTELGNIDLLREILEIWPSQPTDDMVMKVAAIIFRYDCKDLLPVLSSRFPTNDTLANRHGVLSALKKGFHEEAERTSKVEEAYQHWINLEIKQATTSTTIMTSEDGAALAKISSLFPAADFLNEMLPQIIKMNAHFTRMTMAFLTGIFSGALAGDSYMDTDFVQSIFMIVVQHLIPKLDLDIFMVPPKPVEVPKLTYSYYYQAPPQPPPPLIVDTQNYSDIANLILQLHGLELHSQLSQTLTQLSSRLGEITKDCYSNAYIPFLLLLGSKLEEGQITMEGSIFQRFYQRMLSGYILHYVSYEPQAPRNHTRHTISCPNSCRDCEHLNSWLQSPTEVMTQFPLILSKIEHIKKQCLELGGLAVDMQRRLTSSWNLIVRKDDSLYQNSHRAWAERSSLAKTNFQSFGEFLKALLGDKYMAITTFNLWEAQNILSQGLDQQSTPLPQPTYSPQPWGNQQAPLQRYLPAVPIQSHQLPQPWEDQNISMQQYLPAMSNQLQQDSMHLPALSTIVNYSDAHRTLPPLTKPRKTPGSGFNPSGAEVIELD